MSVFLIESVSLNNIEKTQQLLSDQGFSLTDDNFSQLLFIAAMKDFPEILSLLLSFKNLQDKADKNEVTPLIIASMNGSLNALRVLLENGAEIDHQDIRGNTALHNALSLSNKNSIEMVKMLVHYGANTHIENKYGKTVEMLAKTMANK